MSELTFSTIETLALETGKPVWQVLDEIVERELNLNHKPSICNQPYQLKRISPITGSLILRHGSGTLYANCFTPVIRWL